MSHDEIRTDTGRDRLAACAFKLPVDGRMVSMCEVNATGVREAFYARAPGGASRPPSSLPLHSATRETA
jgi:hypothetical protein